MPHSIYMLSPKKKRGGNLCTIGRISLQQQKLPAKSGTHGTKLSSSSSVYLVPPGYGICWYWNQTSNLISEHLRNLGYECQIYDPKDFSSRPEFSTAANRKDTGIIIGIHALHSGAFMKDSCLPYILIFGGTDINIFCDDSSSMKTMTEAVYGASYVVCFSQINKDKVLSLWPIIRRDRLKVISQAVETYPSSFSLQSYLDSHQPNLLSQHPIGHTPVVFIFVGGIRPVKNPLFLVSTFQDWHARDDRIIYLMVGPKLDDKFTDTIFVPAIKKRPGVVYIPGLSSEDTHAVISQSFALVNTSDSEGMCLAILEAMHLGIPVLARDCPGNQAIITDGITGYLFPSPQIFVEKAEQLLNNKKTHADIARNAQEYVHHYHNLNKERLAYTDLLKMCIKEIEEDS